MDGRLSYNKALKFIDENSDQMWQTEPVAAIYNLNIIIKQAESLTAVKSMFEDRISGMDNVQEAHYSVLSDTKVLEVIEGDFSIVFNDSTEVGSFNYVGTAIWANIDGE